MRTQQRSFVVEIKSARRRLKTQPKSIWGNTDFAALVRDTEATLPFMHNASSETLVSRGNLPLEPEKQIEIADLGVVGEEQHRVTPLIETDQIQQNQKGPVCTDNEVLDAAAVKPKRQTGRSLMPLQKRRGPIAENVSALLPVQATVDREQTPLDELALLEAENLSLKHLLADYLGQQNVQLREMLKRFEIV